jgi:hypothetical protein
MDNKPKQSNKIIWLLAATVAFGGYYFYSINESSSLQLAEGVTPEIQANADLFLARLSILSQIDLQTEVFDNEVFKSYQSFTLPVPEQPVGRANPFTAPGGAAFEVTE